MRDLEITVQRKGKPVDRMDMRADPDNIPGLQAVLKDWLVGDGWSRGFWGQFSLAVRYAGSGRIQKTVRL